ncbi:MAG TPA: hypothetical protein VNF05_10505 [Acidimicrobiales bacterium]|nr:hypothetical protein [Acidimicrobiales bacterium]
MNAPRGPTRSIFRSLVALGLLIALSVAPVLGASSGTAASLVVPEILARVPGSRTVFMVDLAGCRQLRCLRLYRTSVSASTFSAVSLPPLSAVSGSLTGDLRRLVFATSMVGYALVGESLPARLYETGDGARTWRRVTIGPGESILGLTVSPSSIYVVTAHCSPSGDACRRYLVSRSTLRARAWTSTTLPHAGTSEVYDGEFDPNVGAYGNDLWVSEMTPAGSTIFASHDGGTSYSAIAANKLASVSGCALTAVSRTSLWAQCPTGMMASFFHSGNGGVSWSNVSLLPFAGTGGGAFDPVSATLAYLAYGVSQPFVRVGGSGHHVTTVEKLTCSHGNASIDALVFTDREHGLAICTIPYGTNDSVLLRTTDGGVRWVRVRVG